MCGLVFSQLYCIIGSYTTVHASITYGKNPLLGTDTIPGSNDEPYSDRSIVCIRQSHNYNPMTVNEALEASSSYIIDTNGTSIDGYRVVKRSLIGIGSTQYEGYTALCDEISEVVPRITAACRYLGYDVLTDGLRIVDDLNSSVTHHLTDALPVLILPYWDNAVFSRYVMNGADGNACMFRLRGRVYDPTNEGMWLMTSNRSIREQKTIEWLGRPGGSWRNGWYEDLTGMRWYSDIFFERSASPFMISNDVFDLDSLDTEPLDLQALSLDMSEHGDFKWGTTYVVTDIHRKIKSVAISNGSRFGLFYYSTELTQITSSNYDIETFVSNASVLTLLFRWMVVMGVLQKSYFQQQNPWENAGVGCLGCSSTFMILPIIILPRLKSTLMAFFSLGCAFEGDQKVYAETWFVMYPAIAEFVMFYFSILNLASMAFQYRTSDVLFGPTLMIFSFMHYARLYLAQSGLLAGVDGRITALVTPDEFKALSIFDFFTSGVALRINGNVKSLFFMKLGVLVVNVLPLFLFSSSTSTPKGMRVVSSNLSENAIERILSIRLTATSGLGSNVKVDHTHIALSPSSPHSSQIRCADRCNSARGYEILRLGYVRISGRWFISVSDWHYFAVFSLTEWTRKHFNIRILLIEVWGGNASKNPNLITTTLDDQRLEDVRWWQISMSSI